MAERKITMITDLDDALKGVYEYWGVLSSHSIMDIAAMTLQRDEEVFILALKFKDDKIEIFRVVQFGPDWHWERCKALEQLEVSNHGGERKRPAQKPD